MTIDEAIKIEKYYGKKDKKALEKLQKDFPMIDGIMDNNLHEQLADWLEELKNLRAENAYLHCEMQAIGATMDMFETEIRNKAIDDYVERLKETYKPCKEADNYMYTNVCRRFDDIAEQLKAGGIDGNERADT